MYLEQQPMRTEAGALESDDPVKQVARQGVLRNHPKTTLLIDHVISNSQPPVILQLAAGLSFLFH